MSRSYKVMDFFFLLYTLCIMKENKNVRSYYLKLLLSRNGNIPNNCVRMLFIRQKKHILTG